MSGTWRWGDYGDDDGGGDGDDDGDGGDDGDDDGGDDAGTYPYGVVGKVKSIHIYSSYRD